MDTTRSEPELPTQIVRSHWTVRCRAIFKTKLKIENKRKEKPSRKSNSEKRAKESNKNIYLPRPRIEYTMAVGGNGHIGGGLSDAGSTRYEPDVATLVTPAILSSESDCECVSSRMYWVIFDCISSGSFMRQVIGVTLCFHVWFTKELIPMWFFAKQNFLVCIAAAGWPIPCRFCIVPIRP